MLLNLLRFAHNVADIGEVCEFVRRLSDEQIDFVSIEARHIVECFNHLVAWDDACNAVVVMIVMMLLGAVDDFMFVLFMHNLLDGVVEFEISIEHIHVETIIPRIDSKQARCVFVDDVVMRVGVIVFVSDELRRKLFAELHEVRDFFEEEICHVLVLLLLPNHRHQVGEQRGFIFGSFRTMLGEELEVMIHLVFAEVNFLAGRAAKL